MLIGLLAQYLAHTVVASHRQTDAAIDCNFFPWAHSHFVGCCQWAPSGVLTDDVSQSSQFIGNFQSDQLSLSLAHFHFLTLWATIALCPCCCQRCSSALFCHLQCHYLCKSNVQSGQLCCSLHSSLHRSVSKCTVSSSACSPSDCTGFSFLCACFLAHFR